MRVIYVLLVMVGCLLLGAAEDSFRQKGGTYRPPRNSGPPKGTFKSSKGVFKSSKGVFKSSKGVFKSPQGNFKSPKGNFSAEKGRFSSKGTMRQKGNVANRDLRRPSKPGASGQPKKK